MQYSHKVSSNIRMVLSGLFCYRTFFMWYTYWGYTTANCPLLHLKLSRCFGRCV